MSTTVAGLPALRSIPATDRRIRPVLATLVQNILARVARTDRGDLAELAPHLRADIGLPPIPEMPRLRTGVIVGW